MGLHIQKTLQNIGFVTAAGAMTTVALIGPGIVADAMSPVPANTTAQDIGTAAVLPDRTVGGFVGAALDGSGNSSRLGATLQGIGQDIFELVTAPGRTVVVALR